MHLVALSKCQALAWNEDQFFLVTIDHMNRVIPDQIRNYITPDGLKDWTHRILRIDVLNQYRFVVYVEGESNQYGFFLIDRKGKQLSLLDSLYTDDLSNYSFRVLGKELDQMNFGSIDLTSNASDSCRLGDLTLDFCGSFRIS